MPVESSCTVAATPVAIVQPLVVPNIAHLRLWTTEGVGIGNTSSQENDFAVKLVLGDRHVEDSVMRWAKIGSGVVVDLHWRSDEDSVKSGRWENVSDFHLHDAKDQ